MPRGPWRAALCPCWSRLSTELVLLLNQLTLLATVACPPSETYRCFSPITFPSRFQVTTVLVDTVQAINPEGKVPKCEDPFLLCCALAAVPLPLGGHHN